MSPSQPVTRRPSSGLGYVTSVGDAAGGLHGLHLLSHDAQWAQIPCLTKDRGKSKCVF